MGFAGRFAACVNHKRENERESLTELSVVGAQHVSVWLQIRCDSYFLCLVLGKKLAESHAANGERALSHTHGAIDKTFRPPFCVAKGEGLRNYCNRTTTVSSHIFHI
jgi:hypothetical protein